MKKKFTLKKRLKIYMYMFILTFILVVPALRYYASSPWINACVLEYVDTLDKNNYKWYIYNIRWNEHLEPSKSDLVHGLTQYKIWTANGCIMQSDNFFSDVNNTFYCTVTYLIKNSPLPKKLKQPLWILKDE